MKGTLVSIWLTTLTRLYGESQKNEILKAAGWHPQESLHRWRKLTIRK